MILMNSNIRATTYLLLLLIIAHQSYIVVSDVARGQVGTAPLEHRVLWSL